MPEKLPLNGKDAIRCSLLAVLREKKKRNKRKGEREKERKRESEKAIQRDRETERKKITREMEGTSDLVDLWTSNWRVG